jgi:hypothetical protein
MWWGTCSGTVATLGLVLFAQPPQPGVVELPARGQAPAAERTDEAKTKAQIEALPTLPARVAVSNQMGKRFKLVEATLMMDGVQVAHREAAPGQELDKAFQAYEGAIMPGEHILTVELVYEGRNLGPFTYLDNYRFRVDTSYPFTAAASAPASLNVVARERPGGNVPIEQKPMVDITPAAGSGASPTMPAAAPVPRNTPAR